MKTIRLLAVVLGMLGVLACSWIGPLDSPAAEQIDAGLKRALVTYAAVRTIGGVLSVVQATQIGGVGATLSPFQFLAPANEMIKQLADVMLLACVAFGVQKILITISGYWAISMVLTAVIVAWVLCQYRWGRSPRWLSGALVFVLLLRFAIPVSTLGTHLISQQFLAKEFNAANAEIISTAETANQIKPPEPTAGDGKSRLPQMSGWVPSVTDIKGSLSKIHHAIDRAVEHLITQIAVFLTETVILPLLLLWTIIRIARLVVARACLVPELKAQYRNRANIVAGDLWADALGALLLGLGVFFGLRFKKRRFDRTNHSGIEVFRSYWSMIGAKFKDASLCLLSLLFTLTGVLLIAFNHFDSWGWVVVFPALIFGVFLPLGSWKNKRP